MRNILENNIVNEACIFVILVVLLRGVFAFVVSPLRGSYRFPEPFPFFGAFTPLNVFVGFCLCRSLMLVDSERSDDEDYAMKMHSFLPSNPTNPSSKQLSSQLGRNYVIYIFLRMMNKKYWYNKQSGEQ